MKEIVYFRESAWQSIVADFVTFLFLGVLFAFNHFYMGDSKVAGFVFFLVFILFALGKVSGKKKVFTSKEELKKYLDHEN